jgi:hypothetical protein
MGCQSNSLRLYTVLGSDNVCAACYTASSEVGCTRLG